MDANYGIATGAYVDNREDWQSAIARAEREGWRFVELTAVGPAGAERFRELSEVDPDSLTAFERVSIHAPVRGASADEIVSIVGTLAFGTSVIFHPDAYRAADSLRELGAAAIFENMDIAKSFGRSVEDMTTTFARFPDAGFCLDVAHVWTNDPSLELGHRLLDAFDTRLRQLHVSGIEPDGTHRETTEADLELYAPLLERCRTVPWLLEAELSAT